MKRTTPFLLLLLIGCAEQEETPQQKATATLKNHYEGTVGKDYQPLQTKLDSFYLTYDLTAEGSRLVNEYNAVHAENKDIYSPNALFLANREMSLMDTISARTKRFGQRFCGWKAIHSYRFKDDKGVATQATDTLLLNKHYELMRTDTITL